MKKAAPESHPADDPDLAALLKGFEHRIDPKSANPLLGPMRDRGRQA
jgi:hypothetical protein